MTLKWMAIIVGAISATLCVTANIMVTTVQGAEVPVIINIITITTTGSAVVLAVVADLHDRVDNRLTALTEFLVTRLNEVDSHTGDRNAGFVEGYLLSQGPDAAVVPIASRSSTRRVMAGGED